MNTINPTFAKKIDLWVPKLKLKLIKSLILNLKTFLKVITSFIMDNKAGKF